MMIAAFVALVIVIVGWIAWPRKSEVKFEPLTPERDKVDPPLGTIPEEVVVQEDVTIEVPKEITIDVPVTPTVVAPTEETTIKKAQVKKARSRKSAKAKKTS